jgi:hypothetical protein
MQANRKASWTKILTSTGETISGFNKMMLQRLTREISSRKYSQDDAPREYSQEEIINNFVQQYQRLPMEVRAKVEKWDIDPAEIVTCPGDDQSEGSLAFATYRGLQVDVRHRKINGVNNSKACNMRDEIETIARLRHPNIVGFVGASISTRSCMVVTEAMRYQNLYALFRAHSPSWKPSRARTQSWSLDLVRAVNYLHQNDPGITHRALRPDVLSISGQGQLMLSSLSFRSFIKANQSSATQSCIGEGDSRASSSLRPTKAYDAPELRWDPTCAHPSVDIYSVAMVIWFLRTGRDPDVDTADDGSGWAGSCLPRRCPLPPTSQPSAGALGWGALAVIVERAWAELPSERPTADELTEALEALESRPTALKAWLGALVMGHGTTGRCLGDCKDPSPWRPGPCKKLLDAPHCDGCRSSAQRPFILFGSPCRVGSASWTVTPAGSP